MPSARNIRGGGADVEIGIRDRMQKGLNRAAARLRSFGASATRIGVGAAGAGAAILTPVAMAVRHFTEYGDSLDKAAARTGTTSSAMAEMGFAAEQSGASLKDIESGFKGMTQSIGNFKRGSKSAVDSFGELGISVEQLEKLSPEDRFQLIADRLADVEDPTQRAFLAMQTLGRGGKNLTPMLANLRALRQQARDLNIVPDTAQTARAAQLGDALNILKQQLMAVVFQIGDALAPVLIDFLSYTQPILAAVIQWVKENQSLVRWIALIGVSLVAGGGALIALGTAAGVAAFAISGLGAAVGVVIAIIKGLIAVLAFLVSPVGLVIVAVVAAVAALLYFSGVGSQVVNFLTTQFGQLWSWTKNVFEGIAAALKAGDLKAAAKILWLALQVVWQKGLLNLQTMWLGFKHFTLRVFDELRFGLVKIFAGIIDRIGGLLAKASQLPGLKSFKSLADDLQTFSAAATAGADGLLKSNAKAREREGARLLKETQERLNAAQAELLEATAAAKAKAAELKEPEKTTLTVPEPPEPPAIEKRNSVQGTFSGAAASRFSFVATSAEKKIVDATERTADAAERTAEEIENMPALAWG